MVVFFSNSKPYHLPTYTLVSNSVDKIVPHYYLTPTKGGNTISGLVIYFIIQPLVKGYIPILKGADLVFYAFLF